MHIDTHFYFKHICTSPAGHHSAQPSASRIYLFSEGSLVPDHLLTCCSVIDPPLYINLSGLNRAYKTSAVINTCFLKGASWRLVSSPCCSSCYSLVYKTGRREGRPDKQGVVVPWPRGTFWAMCPIRPHAETRWPRSFSWWPCRRECPWRWLN